MTTVEPTLLKNLHAWLDHDDAANHLQGYFAEPTFAPGEAVYSGRYFERLGGGGDRPETRDRFTAEDLLAVETLSVKVPPETSITILHGELGTRLAELLREIPNDIAMGAEHADTHLGQGSPAEKVWSLLKEQPGCGWVTAGKLLARKRPHLIPVYDTVVRCALGPLRRTPGGLTVRAATVGGLQVP